METTSLQELALCQEQIRPHKNHQVLPCQAGELWGKTCVVLFSFCVNKEHNFDCMCQYYFISAGALSSYLKAISNRSIYIRWILRLKISSWESCCSVLKTHLFKNKFYDLRIVTAMKKLFSVSTPVHGEGGGTLEVILIKNLIFFNKVLILYWICETEYPLGRHSGIQFSTWSGGCQMPCILFAHLLYVL